jgi:hypothetical protein
MIGKPGSGWLAYAVPSAGREAVAHAAGGTMEERPMLASHEA